MDWPLIALSASAVAARLLWPTDQPLIHSPSGDIHPAYLAALCIAVIAVFGVLSAAFQGVL